MKVLYAIQGTGNGHLSRAHEIVPILQKYVQVDTLISGNQAQIKADFPIDYQRTGLTFLSGKNGDISILKSLQNTHPIDLVREIRSFPIKQYDLVLSDFETNTSKHVIYILTLIFIRALSTKQWVSLQKCLLLCLRLAVYQDGLLSGKK